MLLTPQVVQPVAPIAVGGLEASAPPKMEGEAGGPSEGPPPADLGMFLAANNLSQYDGALRSLGAEQTSDLVDLTEGDMEGIGMKKLEIKRLQRAVGASG